MANREACEVYIEQEIQSGLNEGKTPYSIGNELAIWLEKTFETNINSSTIIKRAQRLKKPLRTNVLKLEKPQNNSELGGNIHNFPTEAHKIHEEVNQVVKNERILKKDAIKKIALEKNIPYNTIKDNYYKENARLKKESVKEPEFKRSPEDLQKEKDFWDVFPEKITTLTDEFRENVFSPPSKNIPIESIECAKDSVKDLMFYLNNLDE